MQLLKVIFQPFLFSVNIQIIPPAHTVARQTNSPTAKVVSNPNLTTSSNFEDGDGKQELCPESGVFIPTIKLCQCHHKSGAEMKVLFHVLMDHFFNE